MSIIDDTSHKQYMAELEAYEFRRNKMSYDTDYAKRLRRSRGVRELYIMVDDIRDILDHVKNIRKMHKSYKRTSLDDRRMFKREVHRLLKCYEKYGDVRYLHVQHQHQSYNEAFEKMLDYQKNKTLSDRVLNCLH